MENTEAGWYIVKQASDQCQILSAQSLKDLQEKPAALSAEQAGSEQAESEQAESERAESEQVELDQWGPFESKAVAISRRVGLIRAGKCKPV